jgi:hypothetical protein
MPAGIIYEMSFKNVEDKLVRVLISDNSTEADVPVIIPMEPAGDPLRISTIDNNEDKFNPIKAQQATISFFSDGQQSLETFSDGPDDRFGVSIEYDGDIIFTGFLSLNDNQEDFLPPRNVVTLTANDKLGALKEIPLTDNDGLNPQGKYKLIDLIVFCLKKTGLNLPIRAIHNLRHGTGEKTFQATFGDPNALTILTENVNARFFYPGQRVQISGTDSNNIEFTVLTVSTGIVGVIIGSENFTLEADVNATFTDLSSQDHFFNGTYLDAKTFETEIGASEDCYTVLKKILGYDCFLTQHKGEWWICRIDEYENNPFYVTRYDEDGVFIDTYEDNTLSKNFGKNDDHWFSDESTIVTPKRPNGFIKLSYNFNNPEEIVCNMDFDRGDFIEDLVNETNEDGVSQEVKAYDFECWDSLSKEGGGAPNVLDNYDQPQIAGATLYVKKFYTNGTETFREVFIEAAPGTGAGVPYIKSQPVRVQIKDKVTVGVDLRYTNTGGSTAFLNTPAMVGLYADSGKIYWWKAFDEANPDAAQQWIEIDTSDLVPDWYRGATVDKEWNLNFTSPPLPETGNLFIYLINQYGESIQAHYSGFQVSVLSFINGSYKDIKGRYYKVSTPDAGYLASIDDEVFMSDAERELFKGAMFFLADMIYKLTKLWYNAARFALGSPTNYSDSKPFGEIQAFAVWNQNRLANRIFQYNISGFGSDIPSLVHKYQVTDASPHSINRNFLMLTAEKDLFKCTMNGTIEQVYHTTEGKVYDDPLELKYL